jgi:hypothetical protein
VVDTDLDGLARLLDEMRQVLARIQARQKAAAAPKRCEECHRPEQPWVPVHDQAGRVTGWVGPTCNRRRTEAAERGAGTQLPLAQEGADRG